MKTIEDYPLKELKIIYNLLYAQLPTHTELIDSELLQDLQHHLLLQASTEGIDISLHLDWVNWLSNSG